MSENDQSRKVESADPHSRCQKCWGAGVVCPNCGDALAATSGQGWECTRCGAWMPESDAATCPGESS